MYQNTTAIQIIDQLKQVYTGDKFHFDFSVSQYLSGDHNKELRREIVQAITGERKPVSKCGMYAVADILKSNFDQLQLF